MINVSTAFKNAMKAPVKTVNATVAFVGGDTYTSGDNLVKCELQASGYYFGVATKAVTVVLLGTNYNLVDKKFDLTLKVLTDSTNDTWEDCTLGRFKVVEQTIDLEKEMTTLKAYDAIGIIGSKLYEAGDFTFPITVNDLAERLAADSGMSVDELELVNGTYQIPEDLYANINNITHRDILAEISGATASLAAVHGVDSDLTFTAPMMAPVDALGYENLKKIKYEPKYGKVSSVVIARMPQEDNIAVVDEETTKEPSGKNLFDLDKITEVSYKDSPSGSFTAIDHWARRICLEQDVKKMLMPSTTYTFSADVKLTVAPSSTTSGANHNRLILLYKPNATNADMLSTDSRQEKDDWQVGETKHISRTFTTPSDLTGYNILSYCYYSGSAGTGTFEYSNVQLELGSEETPFEQYTANGIVEVKLANNEILDDNREAMATPILNAVKGLEFHPFQATTEGHGWHEVGDRLRVFNEAPNIPVEYQEVEYIESTTTQWIDTGVLPQDIDTMEADITYGTKRQETNKATFIGGYYGGQVETGATYWSFVQVDNSNGKVCFGYDFNWYVTNATWQLGERKTVKTVLKERYQQLVLNGQVVVTYTNPTVPPVSTGATTPLLAYQYQGNRLTQYGWGGKIYYLKLLKGDVLVRDFVPCYRKSDNVAGLYDKVNGVFYTNAGTGTFTVGAKTGIDVDNDGLADVVVTDVKLTIDGGLREELKGVAPDETRTNYALAGGIKKTIYNTEIKVDKQGQEITSIVSRQDQFEDQTLDNFSQVVQNINSVVTTIQTTGGGNLIHNSVGYNKNTDGSLVAWTASGTVSSETSPESVSYGAISGNQINLGASSSISQRVTVDTTGSVYTLGFKAKKGAVGTVTVHMRNSIDDYSITIPNGEAVLWSDFTIEGMVPHDNYFDVVITADSNVAEFAITDLMLTIGDSKTPWVSASDEILSRNVAVDSDGVKVTSNTSNDYVKLDELGLNGYSDATGTLENVFTINRDLTEVSKLKARNQIEMPPLKIVPITSGSRAGWSWVKNS